MKLNILFEDKHIIVVEKPPKVPSQADPSGDPDMLTLVREYLKETNPSVKKPYVEIVHRLDRPVGGIMVFPKTKFACSELNRQIQNKEMDKKYYCVACGEIEDKEGKLIDYLKRLKTTNMSKVVSKDTSKAKEAILEYKVIGNVDSDEYGKLSLLQINLITGRHHQIRLQLSNFGYPLWGDTKYSKRFGRRGVWTQIALFACELSFKHPKTKKVVTFKLDKPDVIPFNIF